MGFLHNKGSFYPIGDQGVLACHGKGIDDKLFEGDYALKFFDNVMDEDLKVEVEDYLQYGSPMKQPYVGTLTDESYYNYDFGAN